ncbi:MAG: AgmX/PglI C-terminal domain-containing protein [Proteobacteria bacterium]|nr:AgmX/PglI C-terminal domain-containing protein [Pseudomonadota bacterium]
MNQENKQSLRESQLHAEIDQSHVNIRKLEKSLQKVVADLENEEGINERFDALAEVCNSLEHLDELDGFDLFLGNDAGKEDAKTYIARLRERVGDYENAVVALQDKLKQVTADIRNENNKISLAQEAIVDLRESEERKKSEFVIEREATELPFRPMVMPWSKKNDDERQLRKYVALAITYSILMFLVIPMIDLPAPDPTEKVKIPERLAKLLKKKEPKPEPKETDQAQSQRPSTNKKQARKKAESSGLLAFKDNFTELMNIASEANLGANANVSNSGAQTNQAARNLVVAKASSVSGISSASLSRNTGGAGKGMSGGVQFTRVESSIGIGEGGADRPTGSSGPPRTDEEIQIIFDRYKAALYRIYQRELRKDPTLQGNMVLRITITADGSVSLCKVESTDLKSATLSSRIVARVKRFKFGKKAGSRKMTILYPIDFLPAT